MFSNTFGIGYIDSESQFCRYVKITNLDKALNRMKMKGILTAGLILGTFSASGQVRFGTLQEMLEYADNHVVSIQTAVQQEQIARTGNLASKMALLPSVNASAGFNDNITLQPTLVPANLFNPLAPEGTFNEYTFGRKYLYSSSAQASWDVLNFQRWFDLGTTEAVVELNEAKTNLAKYQVYNQLAQMYYSILLTKKYIEISNENVASADSIFNVTADKYEQGIFSEEAYNRSRIQQIQTTRQLNSLTSSLEQLYNQLQSLLNTQESISLEEDFSRVVPKLLPDNKQETVHPEVSVQEAQLAVSEHQLKQTKALHYPTLTLGYQYNYNWAGDQFFNFSDVSDLPQQYWGMKLAVPLFNGFQVQSKIDQAKIQLQQQQLLLENKRLTAQKEDENLQIQFQQAANELEKQEELLSLQLKNDQHSANKYQSGIIGTDERLNKFQDLLQIQNNYMQCLSNYYLSYYKTFIRQRF